MSKFRKSNNRVDENEKLIIDDLGKIHGLSIQKGHDDILVGWRGRTYWYEIKNPEHARKDGSIPDYRKQPSQIALDNEWTGHYKIVTTTDEILRDLGIIK